MRYLTYRNCFIVNPLLLIAALSLIVSARAEPILAQSPTATSTPRLLSDDPGCVGNLAWSPDSKRIAFAGGDKTFRICDVATGHVLHILSDLNTGSNSVAWSPDGKTLASGSGEGTVRLWDAESGQLIRFLVGHKDSVLRVAWSPDGMQPMGNFYVA